MDSSKIEHLFKKYVIDSDHSRSDYFALIKELVAIKNALPATSAEDDELNKAIARAYTLVEDEIRTNNGLPTKEVSFGTSGWRGIIGKDLFLKSAGQVTQAIVDLYRELDTDNSLADLLGVATLSEAQGKGAVLGYDNRFGGELMAKRVGDVLTGNGFTVHYAGESTTGTLSAAVLMAGAAFSINLTPSHNPLEYAGFKFNAADAGPAAAEITNKITENARRIMQNDETVTVRHDASMIKQIDALKTWQDLMAQGAVRHGLEYRNIIDRFFESDDCVVVIDCVHGASRVHMKQLFAGKSSDRLIFLRSDADPTFGGVAPEPSSKNMEGVLRILQARPEALKLGAIIDPDADRIRFTDGEMELDMNMFGAMAYHYLHEQKGKSGMVAKTVATSNFANAIADKLGEEVFEPKVGFKEFKPVIGKALVCFEESDGISVVGHTPEKDAYVGLILALDMTLTVQRPLGRQLRDVQEKFGYFYPARGGVEVSQAGKALKETLARLGSYEPGTMLSVGSREMEIVQVISIDGRKMILSDGSWLMIRPSGTEPKVRFYVEARSETGKEELLTAAKKMLTEIGLL